MPQGSPTSLGTSYTPSLVVFPLCKSGISYCAATALLLAAVRGRARRGRGRGREEVTQCAYNYVSEYTHALVEFHMKRMHIYNVHCAHSVPCTESGVTCVKFPLGSVSECSNTPE